MYPSHPSPVAFAGPSPWASPGTSDYGKKMKVLVVDDSSAVRQRIFATLKAEPLVEETFQARSGEEALDLLEEYRPDFITLDMMLPGISGIEFLAEMKDRGFAPTVVVLTNYPYPAFRRRCIELGAKHFLGKSTDLERIVEILREEAELMGEGASMGESDS